MLNAASPSLQIIAELMDELHAYVGQTVVIKIGGNSIEEDPSFLTTIGPQLEFLQSRHVAIVLVHGGGPQIDRALNAAGLARAKRADGRRPTDSAMMAVVSKVMGDISHVVAEALEKQGCKVFNAAAAGKCFVKTKPLFEGNGDPSALEDRTGIPADVDRRGLAVLLQEGNLVVLKSVGSGADGKDVNVNADDYAMAVAMALGARRLVFATNVAGVLDANKEKISELSPEKARALIAEGVIAGGMIPKVESALDALKAGVGGVAIIDAHKTWALLGEMLTKQGFGTLITDA
jgi:acetylglutamate kinase